MSTNSKSTREKAAAARAAAESSERRRETAMRVGIAVAVLVIVVGIIGAALYTTRSKDTAPVDAALPTGVSAPQYGAGVGTVAAPVLDVYEDFQCPACAQAEAALGPTITSLVAAGKVKVNYHPMNFLDRNLGNDSSTRATAAFGCAVDAGKTAEYHGVLFANHPEPEGTGYTDEQLKAFAVDAGISGDALTTFDSCYTAQTYAGWPTLVDTAASERGVTGTPTFFLNDTELEAGDMASVEAFTAKIEAAASGQ